ncbi:MAG: flagellar basal body P-ring protein FlgI [Spirochaetales bacterium]|nr:flagellar basal body P-ring protein FlgI [Spirochaetales bacterium]
MLKYINKKKYIIFTILLCSAAASFAADAVRIKDLVTICGIRENQLTGIGLVVGLSGKGDSDKFGFTRKMLHNFTENYGFSLSEDDLKSKNVAVVTVNAKVSGFLRVGDSANVTLSSIGDAKSLEGGILLQTALKGADGKIYAAASGRLIAGKKGSGAETTGTIPSGALIEQDIVSDFITDGKLSLSLKQPDFTTANAIKTAITDMNGNVTAQSVDAGLIEITLDEESRKDPISFLSQLELLTITPDFSATVIIDKKSGMIVSGGNIVIQECSVSVGSLSVNVGKKNDSSFKIRATTVDELVAMLNQTKISTDEIVALIEAIYQIGALNAKLIVQ